MCAYVKSPDLNSPKVKKMDWNQDPQLSASSPSKLSKTAECPILNASIENKMNNVAKLRQQFVEEIKNIEFSLKESIKNLKLKTSETKKKTDIITEKLRQANKLLCDQSEIIYTKEQENKALREKVEELYEYQKKIFENMDAIFNTLHIHENLSDQLKHIFDNIIFMQQNDNTILEENLKTLIPDENLYLELNEINIKINEFEKESIQNENEISQKEAEIKALKIYKEQQEQKLKEYYKKINELEIKNGIFKENTNKEKNTLISEIERIINETNIQNTEIINLDKNLSKLEITLKTSRDNENEIKVKLDELNNKINILSKESKQLDEIRCEEDKKNKITLEKLQLILKASKDELISLKQTEIQATNVLEKKIYELRTKLKNFDDIESKINQIKFEINKEEESIIQINKEYDNKNKEYNNKIKLTSDNLIQVKIKLNKVEHKISEFKEEIKALEEEINIINTKYEAKFKKIEKISENQPRSTSINQQDLPNLFGLEKFGNAEKQRSRTKLYTPTLADDDLELDALSLEEQFTHLTETKTPQTESPEKNKKFFKHSNLLQSKTKKEATPRAKGRIKKH